MSSVEPSFEKSCCSSKFKRQTYGWKMWIGENAASLPPDWNKTALSFLLLICRLPDKSFLRPIHSVTVNQELRRQLLLWRVTSIMRK
jgi:hypothetical protein